MPTRRPLRFLIVADMEPRRDSGAAGSEMEIADELERQGHEVTRVWGDAFRHRIRHWNLYHAFEQPRAIEAVVEREVAAKSYDVLQVAQPAGWRAARRHRRAGRPALFVHRSHGFEALVRRIVRRWLRVYPSDDRARWRKFGSRVLDPLLERNDRAIARWAEAHVVSCSRDADFLAGWGVARETILVSAQAPSGELLATPAPPIDAVRSRRILFVGQHAFFKAPMVVAAVFNRLLAEDPELEATWVTQAEAHAEVLDLLGPAARERVALTGWRPRAELREVYDRHGILLFPSFAEGFGKVFLEGMARGMAVVATKQGGAIDLIREGRTGLLAEVGDVDGLVEGVRRLRRDPALQAAIGRQARQTAERHTWRDSVEKLAEFVHVCLARKGGG